MPKTAVATKKSDRKNELTPEDAKAIREILLSVAESYAGSADSLEKRFAKGLKNLAAKVRRLY